MGIQHRRGTVAASFAIVAGLAAGLPACSRSESAGTGTTSSTAGTTGTGPATVPATTAPPPSSDPPATVPSDEDAIRRTIDGFWTTWLAANDPPNPTHPGLDRYYAGAALTQATSEIQKNRQLGHAIRLPENARFSFTVEAITVTDTGAQAVVCLIDDAVILQASTGFVLNDRVTSSVIDVKLTRAADGWRVVANDYRTESEGVVDCAAQS